MNPRPMQSFKARLNLKAGTLVCASLLTGAVIAGDPAQKRTVAAALKPGGEWKDYPTRILDDLPASASAKIDSGLSTFGGWPIKRENATGFFRVKKIQDRWWLIDPEGCLFLHRGVASVRTTPTPGASAALKDKFGSHEGWAQQTVALLRQNGFNGLGAWSDSEALRGVARPVVYTRLWNFMAAYGKKRGGTFQQPGHTGYPGDCIFVFDPAFETFCDEYARQLAATKNDPWLLGHFSDNEMPLPHDALRNYLNLPARDAGREAAWDWLRKRHGAQARIEAITEADLQEFQALVVDRYFSLVARAIRKYDPNHLYLGARLHGADLRYPAIFRACGRNVDAVSVNYYHAWTPDPERLEMWERESGKPILITEWYAKGADSGMANTGGAGWLVKTQRDRGLFYQNFALALLESRVCIGWDWFRYMDNDPADTRVDPSNRDSNKGIVNNRYQPYLPLLDAMKQLNDRAYSLTEFFDRRAQPQAGVSAPAKSKD